METKKQSKNFLSLYLIKKLKNGRFGSAAKRFPENDICRVIGSQYVQINKKTVSRTKSLPMDRDFVATVVVPLLKTPIVILFCLIAVNTVPVKGHWGRWGPWTKCSRTCGQGYKTRSRQCDDPAPLYGGKFCSGTLVQLKPCQLKKTCKSSRLHCLHLNLYYYISQLVPAL